MSRARRTRPGVPNDQNPAKIRASMEKALRLGQDDVHADLFRQLCRAADPDIKDRLDAEFAASLNALVMVLSDNAGEARRHTRIRQKFGRDGAVPTIRELVMKSKPSDGFIRLLDFGIPEATAEMLVLKYQDQFDDDVILASRRRLEEYGVPISGE